MQRANEKQKLQQSAQQLATSPPIDLNELTPSALLTGIAPSHYQPITLTGRFYSSHSFLLDNQMHKHIAGYHVLTPFQTDHGVWLLINRGWIPRGRNRNILPTLPQLDSTHTFIGTTYYPSDKQFSLGKEHRTDNKWPVRIQTIDIQHIEEKLGQPLAPFIVRIDKNSPIDHPPPMIREWRIVNMSSDKHHGYALQWYGIAFALLCLYLYAITHRNA